MSAPESVASTSAQKVWADRRTTGKIWTRTDTMRFIDERSPEGVLWLQAIEQTAKPRRSKQFGSWLLINRTPDFDRAHSRLTKNQSLTLKEILA